MLKSLAPIEPELVRLCRAKTWVAMKQRCETHPDEAKPTTLAMQGASTTALAISVRSGAPIGAIQALIRANASQLKVVHKFSGSILHEALKHRASYDVLRSLLQAIFQYEQVSLLGRQDQQKRNILHSMVVRVIKELEENGDYDGMWIIFRDMVLAYPEAIRVMDADGNTPLVLALLIPGVNTSVHSKKEIYVFRMVQLMVTICPFAATIARQMTPRHWRRFGSMNASNSPPTTDGAPNSLTYAILYGRWESTVRLLFDAYLQVGVSAGMTIVSGYHEVPLHLAITMRSPMTLLEGLVKSAPDAVRVRDMNGLTPVDWMWIRHVVDWCSAEPAAALPVEPGQVLPSTRRYLSSHFAGWHNRATHEMNTTGAVHTSRRQLLDTLLDRMSLLLPTVARTSTAAQHAPKRDATWSLLHSACAVSCPLAVVQLSYQQDPESLNTRDEHAGRLPLHYAAARTGYRASVPVGVSREIRTMEEPSAAMEVASKFVQATRVVDNNNQLPLHIAIETAKETIGDGETEAVTELLRLYPDSLERRDGITKLFPFLQASEGPKGSLNMTFMLLRKHPTLVSSALH